MNNSGPFMFNSVDSQHMQLNSTMNILREKQNKSSLINLNKRTSLMMEQDQIRSNKIVDDIHNSNVFDDVLARSSIAYMT